ncbi:hypothetical protein ZEAMMB73_Zm00001d046407 [Zea mays]|uniref:Uncharacterized protein n=1 Tax=Zea mays TaxID=4577 RepID=K7VVP9_MAIZE|nr:hypothetical protein ZEAMMB73_Zm00001d046407 [Zea mays]
MARPQPLLLGSPFLCAITSPLIHGSSLTALPLLSPMAPPLARIPAPGSSLSHGARSCSTPCLSPSAHARFLAAVSPFPEAPSSSRKLPLLGLRPHGGFPSSSSLAVDSPCVDTSRAPCVAPCSPRALQLLYSGSRSSLPCIHGSHRC